MAFYLITAITALLAIVPFYSKWYNLRALRKHERRIAATTDECFTNIERTKAAVIAASEAAWGSGTTQHNAGLADAVISSGQPNRNGDVFPPVTVRHVVRSEAEQAIWDRTLREMAEVQRQYREHVPAGPLYERHETQPSYSLPNMRLPLPNKSAFKSSDLFEQQRDMSRHDHGLQQMLVAIHDIIGQIRNQTYLMYDLTFVINFSGAADGQSKRYSVQVTQPFAGAFEFQQEILPSLEIRWTTTHEGMTYTTMQGASMPQLRMGPPMSATITARESRVIDLD